MFAFWIFLAVVVLVWTFLLVRWKAETQACKYFDAWIDQETEVLWGIVEGANKRRKTVEGVLKRERRRHSRTAADAIVLIGEREELQARVNGLEVLIEEERSRYRALAAETIDKLVGRETKANVVAGLMRKIAKDGE